MYEWLVAQMGAGGVSGLAFGSLLLVFLLFAGGGFFYMHRLKKLYAATDTHEMIAQEKMPDRDIPASERAGGEQSGKDARRLTLCDSVVIDNERRLVLVRRDDVEHLILMSSAGDMVIEHNIPVEEQTIDAVSMLAIARAEDADFLPASPPRLIIDEEPTSGDYPIKKPATQQDDHDVDTGILAGDSALGQSGADLFSFDESSEPDILTGSDDKSLAQDSSLTDDNDLAASLIQENVKLDGIESSNNMPQASSLKSQVLPLENGAQSKLEMASLFPRRVANPMGDTLQNIMTQQQASLQSDRPDVTSPSSPVTTLSEHLSANQQTVIGQVSSTKDYDGAEHKLEEPPVASYFAGQPKKMDAAQRRNPAPEEIRDRAPVSSARILPLNPFIQGATQPGKAADSVTPPPITPNQAPTAPQPVPSHVQETVHNAVPAASVPNMAESAVVQTAESQTAKPQAPLSSPLPPAPPSLSFINSFLGLPLEQLAKTDNAVHLAKTVTQAHLQPVSQPAMVQLKKPAS